MGKMNLLLAGMLMTGLVWAQNGKVEQVPQRIVKEKVIIEANEAAAQEIIKLDEPVPVKKINWSGTNELWHSVYIQDGEQLTIEAGTRLIIRDDLGIFIKPGGVLKAMGTADNPVVFIIDHDGDGIGGEYLNAKKYEKWQGIHFSTGASGGKYNHLQYCQFNDSIQPEDMVSLINITYDTPVFLENCTFKGCDYGISSLINGVNCRFTLRDCNFRDCSGGFEFYSSAVRLENCNFWESTNLRANFHAGTAFIKDSSFIKGNGMSFSSQSQDEFKIRDCVFREITSESYLISSKLGKYLEMENTIFQHIAGTELLNLEDTYIKIGHSLFQEIQPGMLLKGNATQETPVLFVNSEISNCAKPAVQLESNVSLYFWNSLLLSEGSETLEFLAGGENCRLAVHNCVVDEALRQANIQYRMETDFQANIPLKDFLTSSAALVSDAGSNELVIKEKVLYKIAKSEYRGKAPDIGRKELRTY